MRTLDIIYRSWYIVAKSAPRGGKWRLRARWLRRHWRVPRARHIMLRVSRMALRAVIMAVSFTVEMGYGTSLPSHDSGYHHPFIHPNKVRMRC
jgi:hypothetical protein